MVRLQRLNKEEFILNADLIETLEATPDTVITLSNGKKFMVKNGLEDIVKQAISYHRECNQTIQVVSREYQAGDKGLGSNTSKG
jgi:flagellar protein FlbD